MKLRCRDDTVPKTVDTRSHCKVWLRACNNLPQPPPYISVFWGCGRLLHALNHTLQWLIVSTVFGTVSSLHLNFIFNDFYTCNIMVDVKSITLFTEIDECDMMNGGCQHSCTSTAGSFICTCDLGHVLLEDGFTCEGIFYE